MAIPTIPILAAIPTITVDSYRLSWTAATVVGYPSEQIRYELSTSYDNGETWSTPSVTRAGAVSYVVNYRQIVAPNNIPYYNTECQVRIRAISPDGDMSGYGESNIFTIEYGGGRVGYPGFASPAGATYPGLKMPILLTRPDMWYVTTHDYNITYYLTVGGVVFASRTVPSSEQQIAMTYWLPAGAPHSAGGTLGYDCTYEISAYCEYAGIRSDAGTPTTQTWQGYAWDRPTFEVMNVDRDRNSVTLDWKIAAIGRKYTASDLADILQIEYRNMDDAAEDTSWHTISYTVVDADEPITGTAVITGLTDNQPYTFAARASVASPGNHPVTEAFTRLTSTNIPLSILPFFPAAYIFRTADGEHTGLAAKNLILNADDYSGAIDEDGRIYIENGKADLPVVGSNSAGWKWHKYEDGTAIAWRDLGTVNRSFNTTDSTWPSGWRHPSSAISCTFPSGLFVAEPTHIDAVLGNGTKRGRMYNVYTANETKDDCDIWVWVYGSATETLAINLRVMVVGRWK